MDHSNGTRPILFTRRQVLKSLAVLTAGAFIKPTFALTATPTKDKIRFAVFGDWGTGDGDEGAIAKQMLATHQGSPFDFVLSAGDNIYPDGGGRHFTKKFETPFAPLLRDRVNFYAVLGNHDVKDGRADQC